MGEDFINKLKGCMDLETFEQVVVEFFAYEVDKNKELYKIDFMRIPTNPHQYVDGCLEKMRRRLMKVVLETMLRRQKRDSKILLMKIIGKHVDEYLKEFKKQTLLVHYRAWYTVQELMDEREKGK